MNAAQVKAETVAALKALPTDERDAVLLIFSENLTEREAAQILGVTRHRFRTLMESAMAKLEPKSRIEDASDSEIEAAIKLLPELERQAIQLVFYDDLHHRDAAKILGVTRDTLRMAYNGGLQRLKTQFNVVPC